MRNGQTPQTICDIFWTEVDAVARVLEIQTGVEYMENPDCLGFSVSIFESREYFVCLYLFRYDVSGEIEIAVYSRENFDSFNAKDVIWIPYEEERLSVGDLVADPVLFFLDTSIH